MDDIGVVVVVVVRVGPKLIRRLFKVELMGFFCLWAVLQGVKCFGLPILVDLVAVAAAPAVPVDR